MALPKDVKSPAILTLSPEIIDRTKIIRITL